MAEVDSCGRKTLDDALNAESKFRAIDDIRWQTAACLYAELEIAARSAAIKKQQEFKEQQDKIARVEHEQTVLDTQIKAAQEETLWLQSKQAELEKQIEAQKQVCSFIGAGVCSSSN